MPFNEGETQEETAQSFSNDHVKEDAKAPTTVLCLFEVKKLVTV